MTLALAKRSASAHGEAIIDAATSVWRLGLAANSPDGVRGEISPSSLFSHESPLTGQDLGDFTSWLLKALLEDRESPETNR